MNIKLTLPLFLSALIITGCAKRPADMERALVPEKIKDKGLLIVNMEETAVDFNYAEFHKKILGPWRDGLDWIRQNASIPLVINISGAAVRKLSLLKNTDVELDNVISVSPEELSKEDRDYLESKYGALKDTSAVIEAQFKEALSYFGKSLSKTQEIKDLKNKKEVNADMLLSVTDFMKEKIGSFNSFLFSVLDLENTGEATTSQSDAYLEIIAPERIKVQILEGMVNYKRWRGRFPDGFVPREGFLNQEAVSQIRKTDLKWVVAKSSSPGSNYSRPRLVFLVDSEEEKLPVKFVDISNIEFYSEQDTKAVDWKKYVRHTSTENISADSVRKSTFSFKPEIMKLNGPQLKIKKILKNVTDVITKYRNSGRASISVLNEVQRKMLIAESGEIIANCGSEKYDKIFRKTIIDIYRLINISPPAELFLPVQEEKKFVSVDNAMSSFLDVACDGIIGEKEWENAYKVNLDTGGVSGISYGYDSKNVYFLINFSTGSFSEAGVLLGHLSASAAALFPRGKAEDLGNMLDFPLYIEVNFRKDIPGKTIIYRTAGGEKWEPLTGSYEVGESTGILELALPFKYMGAESGKKVFFNIYVDDMLYPKNGFLSFAAPEFNGRKSEISYIDAAGDAAGPGNYRYSEKITDYAGDFDLRKIEVNERKNEKIIVLEFSSINNIYSAPLGFSLPVIDLYIDVNGREGLGRTSFLPGRNAYTVPADAWEYCVSVSGWNKAVYNTAGEKIGEPEVSVNPVYRTINIIVPSDVVSASVKNWGIIPAALPSNEKGEVAGVAAEDSGETLIYGRKNVSDSNILDLILPPGYTQNQVLGANRRGAAIEIPALR